MENIRLQSLILINTIILARTDGVLWVFTHKNIFSYLIVLDWKDLHFLSLITIKTL